MWCTDVDDAEMRLRVEQQLADTVFGGGGEEEDGEGCAGHRSSRVVGALQWKAVAPWAARCQAPARASSQVGIARSLAMAQTTDSLPHAF